MSHRRLCLGLWQTLDTEDSARIIISRDISCHRHRDDFEELHGYTNASNLRYVLRRHATGAIDSPLRETQIPIPQAQGELQSALAFAYKRNGHIHVRILEQSR